MLNILGISAFYHDSAACLVQDGRIAAAQARNGASQAEDGYHLFGAGGDRGCDDTMEDWLQGKTPDVMIQKEKMKEVLRILREQRNSIQILTTDILRAIKRPHIYF